MTVFNSLQPGVYTVDPTHTEIGFTARHMMVAKVRGTFHEFNAEVVVGQTLAESTVTAEVQMNSVDTRNEDRDQHLRTSDFFDIENHPTMTFRSTEITETSMSGDLTIKGITRPVTFDLEFNGVSPDPWGGTRAGFEATTEVHRKDWDLTWNVAVEGGGVLVSEKIKLHLDVELVAPAGDATQA
ncbi:MAG TPA: YceI family protein [Ornithinicoccus sp.]|nr:YceI family protein [Ornithinicoccus sp.]